MSRETGDGQGMMSVIAGAGEKRSIADRTNDEAAMQGKASKPAFVGRRCALTLFS